MFESRAIIRYLVHAYPKQAEKVVPKVRRRLARSAHLLTSSGQGNADFARVEEWLEVEAEHYNRPISSLVSEHYFKSFVRCSTQSHQPDGARSLAASPTRPL